MLDTFSVATRMSCAASRDTTREEDAAYSLLGIFDVSMPLLCGEGRHSFQRQQHEIVRKFTDQSFFAFAMRTAGGEGNTPSVLFAESPSWSNCSPTLTTKHFWPAKPMVLVSSAGIQLGLHTAPCNSDGHEGLWIAVLNCSTVGHALCNPALIF